MLCSVGMCVWSFDLLFVICYFFLFSYFDLLIPSLRLVREHNAGCSGCGIDGQQRLPIFTILELLAWRVSADPAREKWIGRHSPVFSEV